MAENMDLFEEQKDEKERDFFAEYTTNAYLAYGAAVLKGRALPDVRDGQKPVQTRILYSMDQIGLSSSTKHMKSARIVGDVLGKYHPHGDSAAYEALVRMSQDFSLRYPLIDGQGNFGSRDGDGAAAMRYTEVRLTPLSELLLSEVKLGTVDFKKNYDGTMDEPVVLPARLPVLLLNGSSGIAVGMATEVPPHNLSEIGRLASELMVRPTMRDETFYDMVEGPDFPGGATCISSREVILNSYKEGKGTIALRAKYEFEDLNRGQWRMVITELPHNVSAAKVMEQIEALTNPQPKAGKKALDAEELRKKALFVGLLDTVRDESGRDYDVRLVFEPKTSKIDKEEFAKTILAYTSLETTYSMNLVCIGLDGRPKQKSLRTILDEWCSFRIQTVTRRINFRIDKIEKRLHILEGRKIAFLNIDKVIRVIRESDEPKPDLMAAFGLSEIQAEDILEIRLRQLARLEGIKLDQETKDLKEELEGLQTILSTEENLRGFIAKEIKADTKKFGDERRTTFEASERVSLADAAVVNEKCTILLSKKGWIKQRTGWGVDLATVAFKEGDQLKQSIEVETGNPLCMISSNGRAYTLNYQQIPSGKTDGVPLSSILDIDGKVLPVALLSGKDDAQFFICCDAGYGYLSNIGSLISRNRAGKAYFSLKEGEKMIAPISTEGKYFACLNQESQRALLFPAEELRFADKGRGLQLLGLKNGEKMTQPQFVDSSDTLNIKIVNRGEIKEETIRVELGQRGQRGKTIQTSFKKFEIA